MAASRSSARKQKSNPLGTWDERKIRDYRRFYLFISIIAILIIAVIVGLFYDSIIGLTGDDDDDDDVKGSVSLNCYNPEHRVTPNGTAQFVFVLENTDTTDDTNFIQLKITEKPVGWDVHLDQLTSIISNGGREIRVLTVRGPMGVESGSYEIEVTATSIVHGDSSSDTIKVKPQPRTSDRTVKNGDDLSAHYIGYLADGSIFDTSVLKVAKSDVPKAPSYQPRSSDADYQEFSFNVGEGQVIPGFDEGVLDMEIAETKIIIVPPDKGYTTEGHDLYGKTLYFELTLGDID